jgi:hypothetical protein
MSYYNSKKKVDVNIVTKKVISILYFNRLISKSSSHYNINNKLRENYKSHNEFRKGGMIRDIIYLYVIIL